MKGEEDRPSGEERDVDPSSCQVHELRLNQETALQQQNNVVPNCGIQDQIINSRSLGWGWGAAGEATGHQPRLQLWSGAGRTTCLVKPLLQ